MAKRRDLFIGLPISAAFALLALPGQSMTNTPNIASFGKIFNYLKDPTLRLKEAGNAPLRVEGALFSGEHFEDIEWRNVSFINCDFVGGYEIGLTQCVNVNFVGCRFSGVLSWGDTLNVRFLRCAWTGQSVMYGEAKSKNTVFEACTFVGTSSDKNNWGAVGTHGEAAFIGCKAKWFNLDGDATLTLRDCELENVICEPSNKYGGSQVLIEKCKFRGLFRMSGSGTLLQSLAIRDTQIDNLDLSSVTVKGDVVMERVKGLKMNLALASAGAVDLKEVQISGSGPKVFYLAANRCRSVLLENCKLPSNPGDEKAWIGGAEKEPAYKVRPPISQSVTLRRSRLPELDLSYLNTARLSIDNCELDRVDISNGSIGAIELLNTNFSFTLDLSNTHASSFKQTGGTNLSKLGGLKLDGSNVKVN